MQPHENVPPASLIWNKARNRFEAWKQICDILRRCTIYWGRGGAEARTSACGRDKPLLVRVRSVDVRHWRTPGPSRTFGRHSVRRGSADPAQQEDWRPKHFMTSPSKDSPKGGTTPKKICMIAFTRYTFDGRVRLV